MQPTAEQTPKVLIVGGGPSGLILALSLLRNGVPVRIIEKTYEPRLGQRGAGIMPRSLELFTFLRIIEPVMKKAILTPPVRMYNMPNGVEVAQEFEMCPFRQPTPSHPFLNPVMLGQDQLEKIFHAALAEYDCFVELGTELVSFEQHDDCVKVELVKHSPVQNISVTEEAEYGWMIGCDGARGVVRKQLGLPFVGETRNVQNFIVGDIFVESLPQNHWHIWGDSSDIMFVPVVYLFLFWGTKIFHWISLRGTETPKLFNFLVGGKNVDHAKLTGSEAALKQCFVEYTGSRRDLKFGEIPWMSKYTPNIRMVEKFGYNRAYVVGDAGHVHSPTGGQGMNTGIQDSFNLGWKLALVAKGIADPSLLDTYTEERIPVISEMISQTTELLNRTLNNDESAMKTDYGLFQLGVNYRWSSIVLDERRALETEREVKEDLYLQDYESENEDGDEEADKRDSYGSAQNGRLCAGDRSPDASGLVVQHPPQLLNQNCQLFQIFDACHHTVLIFADLVNCGVVLKALEAYPEDLIRSVVILGPGKGIPGEALAADLVLQDRDMNAREAYCPSGGCGVCIVRPDGTLGAIAKGVPGVQRYFGGVFSMLPQ